jgi:hypothetical protein
VLSTVIDLGWEVSPRKGGWILPGCLNVRGAPLILTQIFFFGAESMYFANFGLAISQRFGWKQAISASLWLSVLTP